MPPRTPSRRPQMARPKSDPTVNVAAAASAKAASISSGNNQQEQNNKEQNDDLKKLIETLKSKLGNTSTQVQEKKAPPAPKTRTPWNRSISKEKEWIAKPAYTILSRVSNHEKVPSKSTKQSEITLGALPHSFLYRPGADGMKVDKVVVKSGKQVAWG